MASSSSSRPTYWLNEDMIYDLNLVIGKGRYATVYRATERSTQQVVAVKVFNMVEESAPAREKVECRLYQIGELELLGLAQGGPHIISGGNARYLENTNRKIEMPMDYYHHDLYYLMQSTRNTRGLIKNHIAVPPWYNTVLTQMLKALAFLHSKKVMISHRDIKPANILYTNEAHFVLADFGHARLGIQGAGELGGSLEFMAPEIYNMEPQQSPKVDVWSLGVLCLDMLRLWQPVHETDRTFERMKSRSWCQAMAEFGKHCDKPELKLMLEMQPTNRSAASEVLYFLESSPTTRVKQLRPSAALVSLVLRELDAFTYNNERELRTYAAASLENYGEGRPYAPKDFMRRAAFGQVGHGRQSPRGAQSPTLGGLALDPGASSSDTGTPRSGTRGSSGTARPSSSITPQLQTSSQASSSIEVIFPEQLQLALEGLSPTKAETQSSRMASSSTAQLPHQPLPAETYITDRALPPDIKEVMESLGWVQLGVPPSSTPMPPTGESDVLAGPQGSATGPPQTGSQRTAKPPGSTTMPPPPTRAKTSLGRSSSPARQQQASVEPPSAAAEPARTRLSRTKELASLAAKPTPAEAGAAGSSSGSAARTPLEGSPGAVKASITAPKPKTNLKPGPAEGERQAAIQKGEAGASQTVGGTDQARTVGKSKAGASQSASKEELGSVQKAKPSAKQMAGISDSTKGNPQEEASKKTKADASTAVKGREKGETSPRRKADASEGASGRQEEKQDPKTSTGAPQPAGGKQEKPSSLKMDATSSQPDRSEQVESVQGGDAGTSRVGGGRPPGLADDEEGGDQEEQQRKRKKKKKKPKK